MTLLGANLSSWAIVRFTGEVALLTITPVCVATPVASSIGRVSTTSLGSTAATSSIGEVCRIPIFWVFVGGILGLG